MNKKKPREKISYGLDKVRMAINGLDASISPDIMTANFISVLKDAFEELNSEVMELLMKLDEC